MTKSPLRNPQRDMDPSGIGKILELFFGGNHSVTAAVLFDNTGETVDYYAILDPFETRLAAAYCGILFESAKYRLNWLTKSNTESVEFSTEIYDVITVPICEEFLFTLIVKTGNLDESLRDALAAVLEALSNEIGC